MAWTSEKVDLAKSLWLEGWTAPAIAAQLGSGFTRCAVIGKMHRLGLSRKSPANPPGKPRPEKRVYPKLTYVRPRNRALPPERIHDTSHVQVPPTKNLTLLQCSDQDCHFPTDSGRYCGHPVKDGTPYCAAHCEIVYMPVLARKRA